MPINHAITIPSANNAPNPPKPDGAEDVATQQNPWLCSFACTEPGHSDTVSLLWVDPASVTDDTYDSSLPGAGFSLPDAEANDPNFGTVDFTYAPPLT